jgi:hypothetical protein
VGDWVGGADIAGIGDRSKRLSFSPSVLRCTCEAPVLKPVRFLGWRQNGRNVGTEYDEAEHKRLSLELRGA